MLPHVQIEEWVLEPSINVSDFDEVEPPILHANFNSI